MAQSPMQYRRIVAGEGADGRSCIIIDEQRPVVNGTEGYLQIAELWRTDAAARIPASADAADHATAGFLPAVGGTTLLIEVVHPDGHDGPSSETIDRMFAMSGAENTRMQDAGHPAMHRTDTVDYVFIISGEIVFITEAGETLLKTGDTLVDTGITHRWENRTDAPCVMLAVVIDANRTDG